MANKNKVVGDGLRAIAERLDKKTGGVFFPNFHSEPADFGIDAQEQEQYEKIKRACRGILGEDNYYGEGGTDVSYQDLSALIHFIADMADGDE